MMGGRLAVAPSVRAAMAVLGFFEDAQAPLTGGEPEHIIQDGRALDSHEKQLVRAARGFLISYFNDSRVRMAVDATTLCEMSDLEVTMLDAAEGDEADEGGDD